MTTQSFNLKSLAANSQNDEHLILINELEHFDVFFHGSKIVAKIGDITETFLSPNDCFEAINNCLDEIKTDLQNQWKLLGDICEIICVNDSINSPNLSNLLFLAYIKKSFLLSKQFPELKNISDSIYKVFNCDIVAVSNEIIKKFNDTYLKISILHHLILRENYRKKVLKHYLNFEKIAQISGPWANLDLPMSERVWSAQEDEEYFEGRTKARQNQLRYNPSYNNLGFAYVWQDLSSHPYSFDKMDEDSPYKSNSQYRIP